MNYLAISGIIIFISSLVSAAFVFFKASGPKKATSIIWSLFSLLVSLWGVGLFMAFTADNKEDALLWGRFLNLVAIFIPLVFFYFVLYFTNAIKRKKKELYFYSLLVILYLIYAYSFPNTFVANVRPVFNFKFYPTPGYLYYFFPLLFCYLSSYGIILLFKDLIHASPSKINQIKYLFLGLFIGFLGGSTTFFPVFNIKIYPFGTILVPAHVITVAYAIIKYRLMDINIAIRKLVTNFLLTIFLTCTFLFICVYPLSLSFRIVGLLLFSILLSLYLPTSKHSLENLVNRLFFGTKYDYQATLTEVSDTVPTIIDLHKLLKYITDKVCESMGLAKGAVLLKDDFGNKYSVQYQHGFDGEKASSIKLEAQGPLVSRMKNVEDVLVRHEMIQILDENNYNDLCADLDKFDAEVVVPIRKGNNILGILTLSDKAGGDTFGQEDFRLLHIIAIQSAVAIENIRLYNKLIHTDRQTFLETLASGVSHEMRNRLVAIRTFIDLFPERVQKEHVEPGYFEFRNLAAREMERLTKIIDGLLSYSRSVSKGGEELKVNALVEESILIIESKLKDKDIKLIKNLGGNVTSIRGDKGRLLQVFINIMQNGIEAMDKNGQLTITSIEKDNEIEVDISDTGKGIDKDHIDAIFEPFFTTKHQGTGLGLSIVQRIVHDHNGQIRVESELGKGTTFFVTFQKGIEYRPEEIKAEEKLGYWEVKKESEKQESSG